MIVELHILQNFAPSNLNRDDTNSPKECQFGGYRRGRISSQCIKRSIRSFFKETHLIESQNLASRTLSLTKEISQKLQGRGKNPEEAAAAVIDVIKAIGLKFKDEKKGADSKTQYLVFIGDQEISLIVDRILAYWEQIRAGDTKQAAKEIGEGLRGGKAVDLALFGRMLADLPDKNIEAACQVAHAISTHKVGVEFDFYTAVDDLQPKEETGAGMMGDIEFNSACYYRYANIDLEQLKKNLGDDTELAQKTVEAFIRAAVAAVPSGKKTSFAPQNPPDFVFAVARDAGSWSLANAFSEPVKEGGDLMGDSLDALIGYWGRLNLAYPPKGAIKAKPAFSLSDRELSGLDKVNNIDELVAAVSKAMAG